MNNTNSKTWAVVIIIAVIAIAGVYCFSLWQKNKSKAGYVDQDGLLSLMGSGFDWFNADYGNKLLENGRNDKVANAKYGYTPNSNSSSQASSTSFMSLFG